jgi:hypothetical protein
MFLIAPTYPIPTLNNLPICAYFELFSCRLPKLEILAMAQWRACV